MLYIQYYSRIYVRRKNALQSLRIKPSHQGLSMSCCVSDSCSDGNYVDGPCLAVGLYDNPGAAGYGYLTCECQTEVQLEYICESVGG